MASVTLHEIVNCLPPFITLIPLYLNYTRLFSVLKHRDEFSYLNIGRKGKYGQIFKQSESEGRKFKNRNPIVPHFIYLK